jgi:hypothetical protein
METWIPVEGVRNPDLVGPLVKLRMLAHSRRLLVHRRSQLSAKKLRRTEIRNFGSRAKVPESEDSLGSFG